MKNIKNFALAASVLLAGAAVPAYAQDVAQASSTDSATVQAAAPQSAAVQRPKLARWGIGVTGGSLGVGPEVSYALNRHLAVRGNVTFLSISADFSGEQNYRGTANLGSGGLMLDYHVGGGGFRLSAGARIDGNRAKLVGAPTSTIALNGTTYSPQQIGTLHARADFATVAPTVTIGYAGTLKHGLKFGIEAGAMFSGSAHIKDITASNGGVAAADLDGERQRIQDQVNDYKVYPILQFSVGYRF